MAAWSAEFRVSRGRYARWTRTVCDARRPALWAAFNEGRINSFAPCSKQLVPCGLVSLRFSSVTVMSLAKDESAPTQSAKASERLCRAAGATFSQGVCRSVIDPAVVAHQCEERGGVYFAAEYCEVPAGGLRPR